MPNIIKGVTPLLKVYKGPLALQKIYKGAIPIWSSGPPLIPGVTYINQQPVNSLTNWFPDAVGGQQLVGTGLQVFSPTAGAFYNSAYGNPAITPTDFIYYDMRTGAFAIAANTAQFMFGRSAGGTEYGNILNVTQNTNYTGWIASADLSNNPVITFFGTANEGSIILNKFRLVKPARYQWYEDTAPANDIGSWVAGANTTISVQANGLRFARNTSAGSISATLTLNALPQARYGLRVQMSAFSGTMKPNFQLQSLPGGTIAQTGQLIANVTGAATCPEVAAQTGVKVTMTTTSANSGNYVTLSYLELLQLVQP